jgi:hypothetical protein
MLLLSRLLILAGLPLAMASPVRADPGECKEARTSYHAALDELSRALQDYTQCLKAGHGEDDCGVAFVDVESAQKDIESAVAAVKDDCR